MGLLPTNVVNNIVGYVHVMSNFLVDNVIFSRVFESESFTMMDEMYFSR